MVNPLTVLLSEADEIRNDACMRSRDENIKTAALLIERTIDRYGNDQDQGEPTSEEPTDEAPTGDTPAREEPVEDVHICEKSTDNVVIDNKITDNQVPEVV